MKVKDLIDHEALSRNSAQIEPLINPLPTPPPHISTSKLDLMIEDDDRWEILVYNDKNFKCPHINCGKIFTRLQNLNSHLSVHSGERPFVCTYEGCQGKFRRKQDLFRHTRSIHMPFSSRPYECPSKGCLMRFARADGLKAHAKKCGNTTLRSNRRKKTAYAGTSFGKSLDE